MFRIKELGIFLTHNIILSKRVENKMFAKSTRLREIFRILQFCIERFM